MFIASLSAVSIFKGQSPPCTRMIPVAATGAIQPGVRLGDGQDEILALADGRRTARDLAFALGRGVYATMLQLSRMQRAGLLRTRAARDTSPGETS
jgi:hypothetical protein